MPGFVEEQAEDVGRAVVLAEVEVGFGLGVTQFVAEFAGAEVPDQRAEGDAGFRVVTLVDCGLGGVVALGEPARLVGRQRSGEEQAASHKPQ